MEKNMVPLSTLFIREVLMIKPEKRKVHLVGIRSNFHFLFLSHFILGTASFTRASHLLCIYIYI